MDLSAYVSGNRGSIARTMGSFKLRLVIYFMLLALLPLVAATVAFSEVAGARRDGLGRLAPLDRDPGRAGRLRGAARRGHGRDRRARSRAPPRCSRRSRRRTAPRSCARRSEVDAQRLLLREERAARRRQPPPRAVRAVRVVESRTRTKAVGRVVVHLPFDDGLASGSAPRAALDDGDRFAFVADGR